MLFEKPLCDLMQGDVLVQRDQAQDKIRMSVEFGAAGIARPQGLVLAPLAPRAIPCACGGNTNRKARRRLPGG